MLAFMSKVSSILYFLMFLGIGGSVREVRYGNPERGRRLCLGNLQHQCDLRLRRYKTSLTSLRSSVGNIFLVLRFYRKEFGTRL